MSEVNNSRFDGLKFSACNEVCIRLRDEVGFEASTSPHVKESQPKVVVGTGASGGISVAAWSRDSGVPHTSSDKGAPVWSVGTHASCTGISRGNVSIDRGVVGRRGR